MELKNVDFAEGRVIWKQSFIDDKIVIPTKKKSEINQNTEWLIGEAVTNLYVGLCREMRGEKLSASRFIQQYAVDRIISLSYLIEKGNGMLYKLMNFHPNADLNRGFPKYLKTYLSLFRVIIKTMNLQLKY